MPEDVRREWESAIEQIVESDHSKKIVVAGPGSGKTFLFKKLLNKSREYHPEATHLVVTFINDLTDELKRDLGDLARVFTFHSYCKQLLHRNEYLREGLTDEFVVFPQLPTLIKSDWSLQNSSVAAPQFVKQMRLAEENTSTNYFLDRSNYYDAVSFDDMVFRVYRKLAPAPDIAEEYDMVLVDEYQDFNLLEVSLIDILARKSPVVIAGDDDQVLYGSLRGSSWDFIRNLCASPDYMRCELPFCLRCPEVIINTFDDIIEAARDLRLLQARISKPYRYFPPYKKSDSIAHPKLHAIKTSVQSLSSNYFGKVISKAIRSIPQGYITESKEKGFPTVLIIGNKQYLTQISNFLREQGYVLDEKDNSDSFDEINRIDGLRILNQNPRSRLGWRIIFEADRPNFFTNNPTELLLSSYPDESIPIDYKNSVIADSVALENTAPFVGSTSAIESDLPTIKLTSFQGAKGLSAQYVFIVGLHNGDLPRNTERIDDIEICKFLVALTRTRKQCYILWTGRFAGKRKAPSEFLRWIDGSRKEYTYVDNAYLRKNGLV